MRKILKETLREFRYCSNPRISPDGKRVSYILQQAHPHEDGYAGDLYLIDEHGSRRLTDRGDVKNGCWVSNDRLVFTRSCQIGGEERPGTEFFFVDMDGKCESGFVLPLIGGSIAAVEGDTYLLRGVHDIHLPQTEGMDPAETRAAMDAWKKPAYTVFDEVPFWFDGVGRLNGKRNSAYLYHAGERRLVRIVEEDYEVDFLAMANGRVLYSGAVKAGGVTPVESDVRLYEIATGKTEILIPSQKLDIGYLDFWKDKAVVIAADAAVPGLKLDPDIYLLDLDSKKLSLLAKYGQAVGARYGSVTTDARLGHGLGGKVDGDDLYFLTIIGNATYARKVSFTGEISPLLTPEGSCDDFDVVGGRLVYGGMYDMKLPEIYEDGKPLTHNNDDLLEQLQVLTPEPYSFLDHDGVEIFGWCIKPAGYEPGKKYPAILEIHGGPRCIYGAVFHHEMQYLAQKGYFVFYCNPRGSDGRGDAFADIYGHYGEDDYLDIMAFTDETLRRYPDIDPARLGVSGGSYGGFMTNWIIGHTDRFKAACSQRSIANWIMAEFISDIGSWYNIGQMGASAFDDLEAVWRQSPLKYARNVKTPTLFLNSNEDFRCWYPDAMQMYTAIKQNGVDTRFCLFHGESHGLSREGRPSNRLARLNELDAWFDKYLWEE